MKFFLGAVIALLLTACIHAYYHFSLVAFQPALLDVGTLLSDAKTALALFVGTFFGIVTSLVLAYFRESEDERADFLNRQAVITAFVISPVIIGGFYDKVSSLDSFWIVFILSYQNGYFWENVSTMASRRRS